MSKKKNTTRQKTFKTLSIVVLFVLAIGCGYILYVRQHKQTQSTVSTTTQARPQNTVDYSPGTPEDNKASDKAKDTNTSDGTLDDTRYESADYSVTITGANVDNSQKVVRVGTLVDGTDSGSCKLTISKPGQRDVTATNNVSLQGNTYSCPVFAIPFSEFPVSGEWSVSVAVIKGNRQASASWQGKAITINK